MQSHHSVNMNLILKLELYICVVLYIVMPITTNQHCIIITKLPVVLRCDDNNNNNDDALCD